ncbi:hypothetical protein LguiA_033263 [Lonicera macranthoides]
MAGKYFVLQSTWNQKFLECEDGGANKFSAVTGNQNTIYQMEQEIPVDGAKPNVSLVHIKCFRNQKYLVPQGGRINSAADKPGKDTLFQIIADGNTIQLRHVKLQPRYACHKSGDYYLQVGNVVPSDNECYNFRIYVVNIPKDGTYTGVNACNFTCKIEEEKQIAASDLIEQLAQ